MSIRWNVRGRYLTKGLKSTWGAEILCLLLRGWNNARGEDSGIYIYFYLSIYLSIYKYETDLETLLGAVFKASVGWLLWRIIHNSLAESPFLNQSGVPSRPLNRVGYQWSIILSLFGGYTPQNHGVFIRDFSKTSLHLTKFHLTVASGKNRLHLDESPRLGKLKPKGTVGKHLRDWSMPRTNARAFVAILKCVQPENYNWVYAEKNRRGGI